MNSNTDFACTLQTALERRGFILPTRTDPDFDSYRHVSPRQMVEVHAQTHTPAGTPNRARIAKHQSPPASKFIDLGYRL